MDSPLRPDQPSAAASPSHPRPPVAPVLVLGMRRGVWLTSDGEIEPLGLPELARRARAEAPILCHAPAAARRLGLREFAAYDVLELFAWIMPARFAVPTPTGLAAALGLPVPRSLEDAAVSLLEMVTLLLRGLAATHVEDGRLALAMARAGWSWGPAVAAALGAGPRGAGPRGAGQGVAAAPGATRAPSQPVLARDATAGLAIWQRLTEWSESGPIDPPTHYPVDPAEARRRLAELIGEIGSADPDGARPEARPQQADYASAVSQAFLPRQAEDTPRVVLAEAGTGVGKTLGYLAPASVWAERNQGPVWISTYTRNLQHQIEGELDRLFPDPAVKAARVVLRKGRENYLCLLNFEEAMRAAAQRAMAQQPGDVVGLGLLARWALATKDGALVGGDLPGWLVELIGRPMSLGLADRRGECIYSACAHYAKCFIEKSVRRARRADIVVANHALVMTQAALGGLDDSYLPTHYVFDEGHHVFDAADGAFSAHLSGLQTADLRRWLLGAEQGSRGRARGLRRRMEDLIATDEAALDAVQAVLVAAAQLPGEAWIQRLATGEPVNPVERFLAMVRRQVLARATAPETGFAIETDKLPAVDGLLEAAADCALALARLARPIEALLARLAHRLDEDAETLDTPERNRLEATIRSLTRRGSLNLRAWRAMLDDMGRATPAGFVDWLTIERQDGRDVDVGLHRHWIDPTVPFAEMVAKPAHGVVLTSATLTDGTGDVVADWQAAEARTGAAHLPSPAFRARVPSPFDYPALTRVLIVTDVRRDDIAQVAAAYRALFLASGGGALGLFTAIARLRAVHDRLVEPLDQAGLSLYAQHVDGMDIGTLIDIFRAEEDASLLGTDAVRDGVDVPGRSLRLIVFDRVPWPRPGILHRARRQAFGGRAYDDMLARLRLKQAFGRLVRRAGDTGVFVILDPMLPSRLLGAFPEGVEIARVGLAEAVELTKRFLTPDAPGPAGG
ncbi:MAG TPA: helicase C-terminal domain-containing protein [Stellaceae bacterium]|nr:helicase C-terminal domain-containing protein [Stellaceae bacterium]